jgi:hypothetical protein
MTNLFQPAETIETARLRLSALDASALESMSSWLPGALAPEWTLDDLAYVFEAGCCVLIADQTPAPLGVAVLLLNVPEPAAACVPFLAIDPARRFRGLGGEGGLGIERYLRRRQGIRRWFAPVPDGRGLAVYFWLRLGYRPLSQVESPGPLLGLSAEPVRGIWMLRDAA